MTLPTTRMQRAARALLLPTILGALAACGGEQPAQGSDSSATVTIAPGSAAAGPTVVPATEAAGGASASGPSVQFSTFARTRQMPTSTAEQRAWLADGIGQMGLAIAERYPTAGEQINLLRALSDSLRMEQAIPDQRLGDVTQLAIYALSTAAKGDTTAEQVSALAAKLDPQKPLAAQRKTVSDAFASAGALFQGRAGIAAPAPAAPSAPAPKQ